MNLKPEILVLQPIQKPACGVTDHSERLILELELCGFKASRINIKTLSKLSSSELTNARLIVQISIYGYQSKGIPFNLLTEVSRAKKNGAKVVGYFHELWVPTASVTSSAYWLCPIQRIICEKIARVLDIAFFNTAWAADWGAGILGARAHYTPTFSNVGELEIIVPINERPARLVCFGAPSARRKGYAALRSKIKMLVDNGLVSEIFDIGADTSVADDLGLMRDVVRITRLGVAAPDAISEAMALARYSMHYTPWSLSTKSGIYAAAIAHGAMPISIDESDSIPLSDADRLNKCGVICVGVNDWADKISSDPIGWMKIASISIERARKNYRNANSLALQIAKVF